MWVNDQFISFQRVFLLKHYTLNTSHLHQICSPRPTPIDMSRTHHDTRNRQITLKLGIKMVNLSVLTFL
jgi:hypothetical protein